MQLAGVEIGT